jgi:hypothetical protein
MGSCLSQCPGEGAGSGADLEDPVTQIDTGGRHNLSGEIWVSQEVLAE